jgi:hypothetical protein
MHHFSHLFDKELCMFRIGPLSETCRVSFQNKNFWEISAYIRFYYKKSSGYVTVYKAQ